MDRNAARNLLLTGFKPKEKNIDTPYLGELDGQLKIVGLSGKQRIDLENQATTTTQTFDKEGNPTTTSTFNREKFIALATVECLRLRDTGEKLLNPGDVIGEHGNDGEFQAMDSDVFLSLTKEVTSFIGNGSVKDAKNASGGNQEDLPASSLPPDSEEPSMNSSTQLIATS